MTGAVVREDRRRGRGRGRGRGGGGKRTLKVAVHFSSLMNRPTWQAVSSYLFILEMHNRQKKL